MTTTEILKRFDDWVNHRVTEHAMTGPRVSNKRRIVIRRTSSLGDCIAATCVAKALAEQNFEIEWQADPRMFPVLRRVVKSKGERLISVLTEIRKGHELPPPDVNLDGAYEHDLRKGERHFAEMFTEAANRQLGRLKIQLPYPPKNYAPKMESEPQVRAQAEGNIKKLERGSWSILTGERTFPRPWVMVCPKSWSFANRTVKTEVWAEACRLIGGTKFWLSNDAPPKVKGLVDLNARHVDLLIEYIALGDLLVSVDTGPFHISCAFGVPCVVIKQQSDPALHVSPQRDFVVIDAEEVEEPTAIPMTMEAMR